MKKPPPTSPLEDEESRVETTPQAASSTMKRQLGRLPDDETSVSISAPTPLRKGTKAVPRGTVGLRGQPTQHRDNEKSERYYEESRNKVDEKKQEHRRKIWDKLDAAKKHADERKPRFDAFRPDKKS